MTVYLVTKWSVPVKVDLRTMTVLVTSEEAHVNEVEIVVSVEMVVGIVPVDALVDDPVGAVPVEEPVGAVPVDKPVSQ